MEQSKFSSYTKFQVDGSNLSNRSDEHVFLTSPEENAIYALKEARKLLQSLIDRGDPNYIFEASVILKKVNDSWTLTAK